MENDLQWFSIRCHDDELGNTSVKRFCGWNKEKKKVFFPNVDIMTEEVQAPYYASCFFFIK